MGVPGSALEGFSRQGAKRARGEVARRARSTVGARLRANIPGCRAFARKRAPTGHPRGTAHETTAGWRSRDVLVVEILGMPGLGEEVPAFGDEPGILHGEGDHGQGYGL